MAPISREDVPAVDEQTSLLRGDDATSGNLAGIQRNDVDLEDHNKANQHVGTGRGLLIGVSVWALIFLQAANISGITTTQSKIAEDLDAFGSTSWFTSTYLIAMSSTSPLLARIAQIFSPRLCIFTSSLLFSLGGIITSQAPSLTIFLVGRAISGTGGAGILTISFILVLELSGKKRRGLFIGLVNSGFTTGVSLGAVVAGALLESMGWRFLFWIQSPLAIVAGIGIFLSIPESFTSGPDDAGKLSVMKKLAKIDYLGAALLTSTICLFLYGMSWPEILWSSIGISIILLLAFITIELYVADIPIIPVVVLKSRAALLSCLAQLGIMAARWMILFYTPTYAISILDWSPASAGAILIPANLGFAIGGILVGWLSIKRGGSFWFACIVTYILFVLTIALISQISTPTTPPTLYLLTVFLNGLSTGAALNYTLAHLLHLTPASTHYISTSLLTTFRGFGGSFGSAIGGGLFVRVLQKKLEDGFRDQGFEKQETRELVRMLLGSPALVRGLEGVKRKVAVAGYVGALRALFLAGAGLTAVMVLVQAGTGWTAPEEPAKKETPITGEDTVLAVAAEDEEWEEGMEVGV